MYDKMKPHDAHKNRYKDFALLNIGEYPADGKEQFCSTKYGGNKWITKNVDNNTFGVLNIVPDNKRLRKENEEIKEENEKLTISQRNDQENKEKAEQVCHNIQAELEKEKKRKSIW